MPPEASTLQSSEVDIVDEYSLYEEGDVATVEETIEVLFPAEPTTEELGTHYQLKSLTPDGVKKYRKETVGELQKLLKRIVELKKRVAPKQTIVSRILFSVEMANRKQIQYFLQIIKDEGKPVLKEVEISEYRECSPEEKATHAYRAHYKENELKPLVDSLEKCFKNKSAIPEKVIGRIERICGVSLT